MKFKVTISKSKNLQEDEKLTSLLPASVGQEYHEGEKLKAIFAAIEERDGDLANLQIEVGDYLQRFTLQIGGLSEEEAAKQAEQNGEKWIEANIASHPKAKHCKLHRWSEWLAHQDFEKEKKAVEQKIKEDEDLQFLLEFAARTFTDHYVKNHATDKELRSPKFFDKAIPLSKDYIIEELAVNRLWQKEFGRCDFLYPYEGNTVSQNVIELLKKILEPSKPFIFSNLAIKSVAKEDSPKQKSKNKKRSLTPPQESHKEKADFLQSHTQVLLKMTQSESRMPTTSEAKTKHQIFESAYNVVLERQIKNPVDLEVLAGFVKVLIHSLEQEQKTINKSNAESPVLETKQENSNNNTGSSPPTFTGTRMLN